MLAYLCTLVITSMLIIRNDYDVRMCFFPRNWLNSPSLLTGASLVYEYSVF